MAIFAIAAHLPQPHASIVVSVNGQARVGIVPLPLASGTNVTITGVSSGLSGEQGDPHRTQAVPRREEPLQSALPEHQACGAEDRQPDSERVSAVSDVAGRPPFIARYEYAAY